MRRKKHTQTSMKHSRNKTLSLLLLLFGCLFPALSTAMSTMDSLVIHVTLMHNGDARIIERRIMDVDNEGTECYFCLYNMGESHVLNLRVTDESGTEYENIGEWDVERSRSEKTNRCGIVTKNNGYEVCWGLGAEGKRTYTTEYTLTGLVRSYPDADGIRHIFMDCNVKPKPVFAHITIEAEDSTVFSSEHCGVWGFRFGGEVGFYDGKIVAYNTESFGSEGGLYVMTRFDKGMFEPTVSEEETFEKKKEEAFEGSDYETDSISNWTFEDWCSVLFVIGLFAWGIFDRIGEQINLWRARRKLKKNLTWYRDIPLDGDLQEANKIINAYRYVGSNDNNLISACILKLVNMGIITIEERLDSKGKIKPNFVIHPLENANELPRLLCTIHDIFSNAAGEDTVLETQELRQYVDAKCNTSKMESFVSMLHSKTSVSKYKNRQDDVLQVFGLKKYLEDFTLLNERGVKEVTLWKDYMIYATLFGIAEKVIKDMKAINPEYFRMDQIAAQMANDATIHAIYSTFSSGAARTAARRAAREARAAGHGGHSSWGGGGGGFSGGGGGGVR